jgi:hypothetical protein
MTQKSELLRIAAELKSTADRLIDCAKEDDKEEKGEDDSDSNEKDEKPSASNRDPKLVGAALFKRLSKS